MMGRPAKLQVWWSDGLYGPDLQARLNQLLVPGGEIAALVNTVHGTKFGNSVRSSYYLHAPESLLRTPRGLRVVERKHGQKSPLSNVPSQDHRYKNSVYHGEEVGLNWRIFLHRDIAFVLPAASAARRRKRTLESYGVAIMPRPTSAHERLAFQGRLTSIARDAAPLLRYIWEDGIVLRDYEKLVSEDQARLIPPRITPVQANASG